MKHNLLKSAMALLVVLLFSCGAYAGVSNGQVVSSQAAQAGHVTPIGMKRCGCEQPGLCILFRKDGKIESKSFGRGSHHIYLPHAFEYCSATVSGCITTTRYEYCFHPYNSGSFNSGDATIINITLG